MSEELKPCPFCGGKAIKGTTFDGDWYVACSVDKCLAFAGYAAHEENAIAAWNRRADHSPEAGKVAQTEPAGDMVERVRDILSRHLSVGRDHDDLWVSGTEDAARAMIALFQPQLEAADEHQRTMEALKDPIAVLVNMQRGTIAVPSLRACLDLHGKLSAWDAAEGLLRAAKELAEYTSYADIVGAVSVNRAPIREWCDKTFQCVRDAEAAGLGVRHD